MSLLVGEHVLVDMLRIDAALLYASPNPRPFSCLGWPTTLIERMWLNRSICCCCRRLLCLYDAIMDGSINTPVHGQLGLNMHACIKCLAVAPSWVESQRAKYMYNHTHNICIRVFTAVACFSPRMVQVSSNVGWVARKAAKPWLIATFK